MLFNSSVGIGTGANSPYLMTDSTSAESTNSNGLQAVSSNGFTPGSMTRTNETNSNFVAWQWKCNGGTTASNTSGSITSTVQANTDAGFSIVTYTGTGATATVGHGLGVAPQIIIGKRRSGSSNWFVGGSLFTSTQTMYINLTNGIDTVAESIINNVTTSTTFKLGTDTNRNAASGTHVAYCFAEKQGYSKFGKYVGNGNANGPFIYTGFKPAFVMVKPSSAADNWIIVDNKRDDSNAAEKRLFPDTTAAEGTGYDVCDMLSNGFKMKATSTSWNGSGRTYIYMAFAENPFVTSTGVPTTAR
tara:strand:- start:280 stop:1185 length:906 start_codon:yes stop_codon:yes gene_type:complete